MKHVRFVYLLLITFAFCTRIASAQTTFGSEEELKAQALKLFDEDEFEEAYPLYSQLTSIYPKDPDFNYRLGVCMLYASDDKEKPIAFLEFASNKPEVEKEVFFYLAKAYHLNYRFDDAIKEYTKYKDVASSAKAEKLMVDRQIEMCRSGKKLLRNLTDLVVIEKKEMSRTDFYRSYDISGIGGKLLAKPDEEAFKTALDKKKKEKSIIYLASNNNQVFFSSYGDNMDQGKDIYIIRKLPTGEWSKPQTLGYPVNTEYDEDFPFLHPNGKVLYFCSKGHNSMGGYDIYKTTLNEETNTWNKPVNLDFPINTPDDDVLYVTNEDEKEAYFSSARASKSGKTAVYHINVERKPIDIAIIKGAVIKNRDNQAIDVKITVKDLADNVILGIFNSKASNGVYLINVPNGGKFLFTVEATGFATQSDVVEVPVQYVFRPMKQEISYELGTDKLIIKNLFDEVLDDASYLLALNFIKEKSKMDVNVNDASASNTSTTKDADNATDVAATTKDNTTTNTTKLTNDDIVKIGYSDAEEVAKEAKDLKEQADVALVLANQKNELAINKAKEAEQLIADASKMSDNVTKQATIEEANAATKEAEELNQETVAAFNLAKKIEFRAAAKEQEAELSMQYAKDLEAAVKSKNTDPALFAKLEEQQKKLDALAEQNNNPTLANSLKMDVDNKKRDWEKAIQTSADIKQEIADNEALIVTTQAEADKERNAKVKQGLLDQVEGLKMDTEDSKKDLALNEQKVAQLQKEYNGALNETALVSNIFDKAKTTTNEKVAADVAMVDKAKLEAQVNTIKNTPVSDNAVALNTTNAKSNPVTDSKTTDTKTTDNSVADSKTTEAKTTENAVADNKTSDSKTTDVAVTDSKTTETKTTDNAVADNKTTDVAVTDSKTTETKTTDTAVADSKTTENQTTDNAVADNTTETKVDYTQKFNVELSAANNIQNDLERENKKAELLKEWSDSISEDIAAKKTEAKTEKDKTKKKELNSDIAALEKELKEKQKSTSEALATVEKLKKEDAVVADNSTKTTDNVVAENGSTTSENNTSDNAVSTTTNINTKYSNEVAATNSIPNEVDREKAKADALMNWSKAIDADVEKKKQELNASSDPEMKALLAMKIKQGEDLSKEKQKEAEQSLAKVERINNPTIAATTETKTTDNAVADTKTTDTKTTDAAVTDVKAIETKTTDNSVADSKTTETKTSDNATVDTKTSETKTSDNAIVDTKTTDNAVTDAKSAQTEEKGFAYSSPTANEQSVKATTLNKEADGLMSQSNDLKAKATAESNTTTRNAIYAEAEEFAKLSETKQLEAAQIIGVANTKEYGDNKSKLDQFVKATKGNTSDDLSMAEMMNDEADIFFNRAQKSRELASTASTFYEKESALEDAYKNEMIALEKQQKATSIYLKYTPDVAAKTAETKTPDNAIVDAKTSETKTPDNSIADVKTTETKTPDNTVVDVKTTDTKTPDNAVADVKTTETKTPDNTVADVKTTETQTPDNTVTDVKTTETKTPDNTIADVKTTETKTPENTTGSSVLVTNDSGVQTNEVFVKTSVPVYSAAKPIPVNEKLPEGLIFKVQIGAFRNPIPQDLFKGMSPITGETTPQGFTRYTAGLFTSFTTADKVKQEIRDLGYKDAFVVAFLNGKRIPILEAMAMAGVSVPPSSTNPTSTSSETTNGSAVVNNTTTTTETNPATSVVTNPNIPVNNSNSQLTTPPNTQNIATVGGLFYTVQIGVYSQIVSSAKLYNIQPLYTETAPNGNFRYNTGIYNNVPRAIEAKNMIVDVGIKDAFVTAYYNGKRISLPEADKLIKEGTAAYSTAPNINQLPTFTASANRATTPVSPRTTTTPVVTTPPAAERRETTNPVATTPVETVVTTPSTNTNPIPASVITTLPVVSDQVKSAAEASNVMQIDSGIVFKVQIGAFKEEVPLEIANKFLKIAKKGVKNYKDQNGLTIYTVGTYKTYAEASTVRAEVVAEAGITDAFIVAYKDGAKISIDEARALMGN
ncbi:MAG: PD40 domain-containing protein [Bacteroidetes bacterium]|nr:PD40 domain-containing protein [Bacteroidota bacterium]